jgi:hypothetical protein
MGISSVSIRFSGLPATFWAFPAYASSVSNSAIPRSGGSEVLTSSFRQPHPTARILRKQGRNALHLLFEIMSMI